MNKVGRYDESIKLGNKMLKLFLCYRRMNALSNNLYSNLWNMKQLNAGIVNPESIKDVLERCIILSDLVHKNNWSNYYAKEIEVHKTII